MQGIEFLAIILYNYNDRLYDYNDKLGFLEETILKFSFKGGAHIEEHKLTAASPIQIMPPPQLVSIPLSQHIGVPCRPTVVVGDYVMRGQVIGQIMSGLGCPVHSSVSGQVIAIDSRNNAFGNPIQNVIIENDFQNTVSPEVQPFSKDLDEATSEEMIAFIRRAGISGMGGATFPTYAKIASALGKVDRMIINCAECEPYITSDHRMMLEHPEKIIGGVKILMKILRVARGDIAIEDNKPDAAKVLRDLIGDDETIKVFICKTKYPQGDERQLMYALMKKELPSGKLPADVGCVLFNCSTCAAIYDAFTTGMPLIERVVTVSGDCVAEPKNVLSPIGASYRDLIAFCSGLKKDPEKLVCGGPMMGSAQWDLDTPVTKGTSALLVFSKDACPSYDQPPVCIRCGRCVKNCPMHLMPNYLVQYAVAGRYDDCARLGVMSCVECGTCSYNCPGRMMIVQYIRVAKGALRARN